MKRIFAVKCVFRSLMFLHSFLISTGVILLHIFFLQLSAVHCLRARTPVTHVHDDD